MEQSYDPIKEVMDKPRFGLFKPREAPGPGLALVLHREGRPLVTMRQPEDRLTLGEAMWSNFLKVYKVDTSEHTLELQCSLPANTDAFDFLATIHLTCAVTDPTHVVERGVRDVRVVLEPKLMDVMRRVSRRFRVEDSADAEHEIANQLRQTAEAADFCRGFGIQGVTVKLELEAEARNHVRELKAGARRHTEEMKRLRQAKERMKLQNEIDQLKAQLDIARSEQFLHLIEKGDWSMLALYLAQNPERVSEVIKFMLSQQHLMLDKQIEALKFFLDKDVVEPSDFEERGRKLLRNALDQLGAGLGSGGAGIASHLFLPGEDAGSEGSETETDERVLEGRRMIPDKVADAGHDTDAENENEAGS